MFNVIYYYDNFGEAIMPNDREKLLKIMSNLESDYRSGKISAEKYSYFRSKYEDKLNTIDAEAATRKIRSMQGKPSANTKKKSTRKKKSKSVKKKRKEEQDLVQKYIVDPKKGDRQFKEKKPPVDNGTFKLIVLLVLVVGFTAGVAYGIFNFDSETISETGVVATVEDTAFPEVKEVLKTNTTTATYTTNGTSESTTYDSGPTAESQTYTSQQTQADSSNQQSSESQSSQESQSTDSGQAQTQTDSNANG